MNWIKKNWSFLLVLILIYALITMGARSCIEKNENDEVLNESRERIMELEEANIAYETSAITSAANARVYDARAKEFEAEVKKSEIIIGRLKKERQRIEQAVAKLPPSKLVKEARLILDCAQIELVPDGALFSIDCTRSMLTKLKKFSLVREELAETEFALSQSKESAKFHEMKSWELYGLASSLGSQVINFRKIVIEKDANYASLEKRKKKSYYTGLWKGVVIALITVVSIKLTFEAIR